MSKILTFIFIGPIAFVRFILSNGTKLKFDHRGCVR